MYIISAAAKRKNTNVYFREIPPHKFWVSQSHFLILTLGSDPRDLLPLRHFIRVMRRHDLTKKNQPIHLPTYLPTYLPMYLIREHPKDWATFWFLTFLKQSNCDIWDTDYNWETEFMTIFVTWQSRVTLDSIRNSCDVLAWTWLASPLDILFFEKVGKVSPAIPEHD